jgi:hypothetical protein
VLTHWGAGMHESIAYEKRGSHPPKQPLPIPTPPSDTRPKRQEGDCGHTAFTVFYELVSRSGNVGGGVGRYGNSREGQQDTFDQLSRSALSLHAQPPSRQRRQRREKTPIEP